MNLDKLSARIQQKEGDKPFPYDDATGETLKPGMTIKGNITIGRGRNLSAHGISDAESQMLERNDINDAIADSGRQSWWPMVCGDDVRSRAMVEMVFNMGIPTLNEFHKLLGHLLQRDFDGAASEYLDSDAAREIGKRANEIAYMLRTGEDITV